MPISFSRLGSRLRQLQSLFLDWNQDSKIEGDHCDRDSQEDPALISGSCYHAKCLHKPPLYHHHHHHHYCRNTQPRSCISGEHYSKVYPSFYSLLYRGANANRWKVNPAATEASSPSLPNLRYFGQKTVFVKILQKLPVWRPGQLLNFYNCPYLMILLYLAVGRGWRDLGDKRQSQLCLLMRLL